MLIIPNEGVHAGVGGKVVVAWNGRREAAQAAFAALPLLKRAQEVKVISVSPQTDGEDGGSQASGGGGLCATLGRHGVKCDAAEVPAHGSVGHTLLMQAIVERADLLVMGCYGHSRLREFVLGGATRHVLDRMVIPVLMAH